MELFDKLFGLSRVSLADPRATLGWRFDLPLWVWVMIALGSAAFAWWSYRHLMGARTARVALAAVRTLLVVFIAVLLAGPLLVVRQEQVEPDWLLVLVDRSESMTVKDAGDFSAGAAPRSRDEALREALEKQAAVFTDAELGHERRIVWLGFDAGTFEIDSPAADPETMPGASGQATSLRTAIEQALQRAAGRPVSGVVVMSDGRSPQDTGPELVRRLQQQAVGVFAVPLGASAPPLDLAVARVEAPEKAFVNDTIPVAVWLEHQSGGAAVDPAAVTVRLVDPQTGRVIDERTAADAGGLDQPIRLTAESALVGPMTWRVEVSAPGANELDIDNNAEPVALELIDRPIKVLYVEGYPRWEYRYLKNMLVREKSIDVSTMLVSADRAFAQEGDTPIARLPRDAEELRPYDVVIVGDVPPGYFGVEQMGLIRDHVSSRGAGLLVIGGPRDAPNSYDATPLADLLPMRRPGSVGALDLSGGIVPLSMRPTPLAEALSVLQLRDETDVDRPRGAWPEGLPPLRWAQDLGPLKPTAEVLGEGTFQADPASAERGVPLVVRLRYGAGQCLYVATDDTWRWRYARGDLFFDQFWVQLVRMLGRQRLQQDTGAVRLDVSSRRVNADQPVVLELRVEDPLILKRDLPRIAVAVTRSDDPTGAVVETVELLPVEAAGADASSGRTYRAREWRPRTPGRLTLKLAEPGMSDLGVSRDLDVVSPDDERRQRMPDHARLTALAEQTGGKVVSLDNLAELKDIVPNRARRTPNDISEPLWDSWLALAAVVLLLGVEWIGRKAIRLV